MTFEKLNKHIKQSIDHLIEDKLEYFKGTITHNSQTWKVTFRRTRVTIGSTEDKK